MAARESEFRDHMLNRRLGTSSPFVKQALWKSCAGPAVDLRSREVYAGLDLSDTADLTALAVISRIDGIWHVRPTFWLPGKGLEEKAHADRVPYDKWCNQGYLIATPSASIGYDYVAQYLRHALFEQHDVNKIGFDRWNLKHLKPCLLNAGLSEQTIEEKFVELGHGKQSMSPALRELASAILDQRLVHDNNPVMNMCAANAVVEGNDSSSRKLSKKRSSGRIDGMIALAIAIGVAPLRTNPIDIDTLIA
jgi:phage terminase large subunit-like protein